MTFLCLSSLILPALLRWLFRHILQFLRDGSLPDDRPLLAQLYREAAFFKLQELQTAIEEEKVLLPCCNTKKIHSFGVTVVWPRLALRSQILTTTMTSTPFHFHSCICGRPLLARMVTRGKTLPLTRTPSGGGPHLSECAELFVLSVSLIVFLIIFASALQIFNY